MVDESVVTTKLAELAGRIDRVRRLCPETAEALARDRDALELVSFNLLLAVQACLDLATHFIADSGWSPASSLAGSFRRLAEHGVISEGVAEALARAAGLRNIVAHLYADVDPVLVHAAATGGLGDLEHFAAEVAAWVRQPAEAGTGS